MDDLYCLSLGQSMCEEWIHQVSQNDRSLMLLPSSFLLNRARRLAAATNHKMMFLSFDELVAAIVTQHCEVTFIDRLTQEMLIEQLLVELSQEERLSYFKTIATFPGYISTVTSLIAEIKRTGTSPEDFHSICEARDNPQKDREIHWIYKRYQEKLAELKLADLEELYLLALVSLENAWTLPYEHIYISEFYIFTPLQREIIRKVHSLTAVDIAIVYEKNTSDSYEAITATYTDLVGMGFHPISRARQEHVVTEQIKIISCPNRQKEIKVVASKVKELLLTGGYQLEEIALVARDLSVYEEVGSVFIEYGIPIDIPQEEKLQHQPLVRLMVDLLTAKRDGGTKNIVLNILKSPYLTEKFHLAIDEWETLLLEQLIFDWQGWRKVVSQLPEHSNRNEIVAAFQFIYQTISEIPLKTTCSEFVQVLRCFMEGLGVTKTLALSVKQGLPLQLLKNGLLTYQKTLSALDVLENNYMILGQQEKKIPIAELLAGFMHLMQTSICSENRDSAGVKFISPASVRGVTFKVVFILGLSDGEFPVRERENWLYKDGERRLLTELGMDISTIEQKRQIEDLYFNIALALAKEKLFLTYYENDNTLPSPYILQLCETRPIVIEKINLDEIFNKDFLAIYSKQELMDALLEDAFHNNNRLTLEQATLLAIIDRWVEADFWRKNAAESERQMGFGKYAGELGVEIAKQLQSDHKQYSISSLEDYASCPFQYFITRILSMNDFTAREEDTGSDVIGTIYHEVLALFMGEHRGEKLDRKQSARYHSELECFIQQALDEIEKKLIVKGRLWSFERNKMQQTLHRWLDFEVTEQNKEAAFRPRFLEWGFGMTDYHQTMDPASTALPLEVDFGDRKIHIVGKIDRIDVAVEHAFRVFDYKKKTCPVLNDIKNGIDLQIPLYLWAVQQHLCREQDKIVGGGYYAIEKPKKAGGMWIEKQKEEWQALHDLVRNFIKLYTQGIENCDFKVAPVECSKYCLGKGICRYSQYNIASKEVLI